MASLFITFFFGMVSMWNFMSTAYRNPHLSWHWYIGDTLFMAVNFYVAYRVHQYINAPIIRRDGSDAST
jgi:hypothetical protein